MSTQWTVTVDCAKPAGLAAFWRLALEYAEGSPPAGFASWAEWLAHAGVPPEERDDGAYIEDPGGVGPGISFLKVPEPKVVKNRVHLDVQAGGGRGEPWEIRWPRVTQAVERLTAAGATVIRFNASGPTASAACACRRHWAPLPGTRLPSSPATPFARSAFAGPAAGLAHGRSSVVLAAPSSSVTCKRAGQEAGGSSRMGTVVSDPRFEPWSTRT